MNLVNQAYQLQMECRERSSRCMYIRVPFSIAVSLMCTIILQSTPLLIESKICFYNVHSSHIYTFRTTTFHAGSKPQNLEIPAKPCTAQARMSATETVIDRNSLKFRTVSISRNQKNPPISMCQSTACTRWACIA